MSETGGKRRLAARIGAGILLFAVIFILMAAAVFGVLYFKGKSNLAAKASEGAQVLETAAETTTAAWEGDLLDENEISYNGKRYRYRESLINILCMGVDQKSISKEKSYGKGGQADAVFLVSLDTETGQITVLNLSRDTMADVNLYTESGNYAGTEKGQLCLA